MLLIYDTALHMAGYMTNDTLDRKLHHAHIQVSSGVWEPLVTAYISIPLTVHISFLPGRAKEPSTYYIKVQFQCITYIKE